MSIFGKNDGCFSPNLWKKESGTFSKQVFFFRTDPNDPSDPSDRPVQPVKNGTPGRDPLR